MIHHTFIHPFKSKPRASGLQHFCSSEYTIASNNKERENQPGLQWGFESLLRGERRPVSCPSHHFYCSFKAFTSFFCHRFRSRADRSCGLKSHPRVRVNNSGWSVCVTLSAPLMHQWVICKLQVNHQRKWLDILKRWTVIKNKLTWGEKNNLDCFKDSVELGCLKNKQQKNKYRN